MHSVWCPRCEVCVTHPVLVTNLGDSMCPLRISRTYTLMYTIGTGHTATRSERMWQILLCGPGARAGPSLQPPPPGDRRHTSLPPPLLPIKHFTHRRQMTSRPLHTHASPLSPPTSVLAERHYTRVLARTEPCGPPTLSA